MSNKKKVQVEDYQPLTENGKRAKEQLLRLFQRKNPNQLPRYFCAFTEEQILEMWEHSKQTEKLRIEKERQFHEVKIQNQKANA